MAKIGYTFHHISLGECMVSAKYPNGDLRVVTVNIGPGRTNVYRLTPPATSNPRVWEIRKAD